MNPAIFKAIIGDIEKHIEGNDGYHLKLFFADGSHVIGPWQFLPDSFEQAIIISLPDRPPVYLPVNLITAVSIEP